MGDKNSIDNHPFNDTSRSLIAETEFISPPASPNKTKANIVEKGQITLNAQNKQAP